MSVVKFELKKQHIALVKNVNIANYYRNSENINRHLIADEIYEEFGLILYGRPEGSFDPTSSDELEYSAEQKAEMDKYFNEFPMALEIMLGTGTFEAGNYKTKHHDINWKKVK